jgi:hypothetical protein
VGSGAILVTVANVNMPAPLAFAGGSLCLLAGYLIGVVAGPQTADQTVATVASYSEDDRELCLRGETVGSQEGAVNGVLCGEWRRSAGATRPDRGDQFRFVTIERREGDDSTIYIYGDVVEPAR